ncbi:MAG: HepT-like ribonuclease domain-containing protein [Pseudomonadota bacterium]
MDRDVIARKIERLRHHVARIESKKPFGAADLAASDDLRDIVVFNLSLFGGEADGAQLANRLKRAVGFRNAAVHAYAKLDLDAVVRACEGGLADLKRFAAAVQARCLDRDT